MTDEVVVTIDGKDYPLPSFETLEQVLQEACDEYDLKNKEK